MSHRFLTRRRFLQSSAAAIAAPSIIPASALGREGRPAPSERVTVGLIGLGSRGFNLLDEFLQHADAQVVALCDVDRLHYRDRPWGQGPSMGLEPARQTTEQFYSKPKSGAAAKGIFVTPDFQELCARKDLDAVVVATPDHWHALCTLTALRSNLDVYCEKPVTHTFHEGQLVYREVAERNAVFQTGSQQRSDEKFRKAVELVLNGHLGTVKRIEVGLPPGYDRPQGDATITVPPEHLDYETWCGPAPMLPYMRARHHRWWRGHRAYGGGVLMDWIGHHNDIAHWALGIDRSGPLTVEAVGWTFPETKVYNTPHYYEIRCTYPGGVESTISSRQTLGTKIIGESGWLFVSRAGLKASHPAWLAPDFHAGSRTAYRSEGHTRNFLDCVKTRRDCIAPPETAHRSITPGHLAYVSQALGRRLNWDAQREQVKNDPEANALLQKHSYRKPWTITG